MIWTRSKHTFDKFCIFPIMFFNRFTQPGR
jgi:hypothetical protein